MRRQEKSLLTAFGYQDLAHFYYAHVSRDDGDHRVDNGIFKVFGGARYRVAGLGSEPALPTTDWTRVRVVRDFEAGKIEVCAGGAPKPRREAIDQSFTDGRVWLGSFDETGDFDDFKISGEPSQGCLADDFSPFDPS